jgi:putative FmdB family regulatory protein
VPIYEYQCKKCKKVTEMLEIGHERPMRKCPSCGGPVERLVSQGAFILKGSGWYATDYGSKSGGNGNGRGNGKGKGKEKQEGEAACPASSGAAPSPACAGCPKASE